MSDEAWVTLATNDTYALGCLVLAQSLKRTETTRKIHCMVTPGVTDGMKGHLSQVFDNVTVVDVLDSGDEENLALIGRPELGITFSKLHCWRLTQYRKCVFLDADTLILANSDELFDRQEFSAAPDIGWPDIFNSGVFVYQPSIDTYRALVQFGLTHGSFDGGDQGLLNEFFSDWREKDASFRLPFTYNMSSNAIYTYTAAYKRFSKEIKIVHFLGTVKPWHHSYSHSSGLSIRQDSQHVRSHIEQWWNVFVSDVQNLLHPQYGALAGPSAQSSGGSVPTPSTELEHKRAWEAGNVDYLGRDSWENIQKRLDSTLGI